MELRTLLAFVDECDVSDVEDQQPLRLHLHRQQQQQVHSPFERPGSSSNSVMSKARPRRVVQELAALQNQAAALTLQLDEVKCSRSIDGGQNALSPWRTECDRQSRLRAAAQKENEQLRDKLQAQTQTAKRLANLLKRCSFNQMWKTILRFESDAKLRSQNIDFEFDEFDHVYYQTDAVLADAEMARLPSTCFDARIRQQIGQQGFFIEIRRRLCVARDRDTTSEAYWRFSPHPSFSKRFVFEQTECYLDEMKGHTFVFQSRQGPSSTRFHGQYLLRRYTTEQRVVIVWKMIVEPEGSSVSSLFRLCGRGWATIYSSTELDPPSPVPSTSIQSVARFYPESKLGAVLDPDHVQQHADLQALVDFVTYAGEGYNAFGRQMALELYNTN